MVPIPSLVVPILLSAVIVFVASSLMHMVLTYHRSDYRQLPKEDDILESLRRAGVQPGDYTAPYGGSRRERSKSLGWPGPGTWSANC